MCTCAIDVAYQKSRLDDISETDDEVVLSTIFHFFAMPDQTKQDGRLKRPQLPRLLFLVVLGARSMSMMSFVGNVIGGTDVASEAVFFV